MKLKKANPKNKMRRKYNNKGQIQTQIFVYIIALLVIALILLYGYNAIRGFVDRSDEVNLVQFRTEFSNAIEMQSHEYRSVIKKQALLPRKFTKMIIVDKKKLGGNTSTEFADKYPIVQDAWSAGTKDNIFLVGEKNVESFYAGNIYFDPSHIPDHIVIDAPDRVVELKLTGMGGSTKIEVWE